MNTVIMALLAIVALAADAQPLAPQKWQNPTLWRNIKAEQSPEQVQRVLGDPIDTESTNSIECWYYADTPKADENGANIRPKHGFLIFRKTPAGTTLQKWVEPRWEILPTWEQLQTDYKQAIADQRAAEQAERQRMVQEAAAERRQRLQARAAAQQRQVATAPMVNARPQVERGKIPPAKPDAHTQLTSRYFISIGIAFVVIALIIAGSNGFRLFKN